MKWRMTNGCFCFKPYFHDFANVSFVEIFVFFFCFFLVWFFSSAQNHKLFCWNFGSSYIFLQFLHLMFSIMTNGQCLVFIAFKHFNRFLFFGFLFTIFMIRWKKKKFIFLVHQFSLSCWRWQLNVQDTQYIATRVTHEHMKIWYLK